MKTTTLIKDSSLMRHLIPIFYSIMLGFIIIMPLYVVTVPASTVNAQSDSEPLEILKVSEIKRGMKAIGVSVFRGRKIEEFPLTIIDVVHNESAGRDMILAELGGEYFARVGVIAGMSGSPVYINGKLIGALSSAWELATRPIAGITPVEQMLDIAKHNEVTLNSEQSSGSVHTLRAVVKDWLAEEDFTHFLQDKAPHLLRTSTHRQFQWMTVPFSLSMTDSRTFTLAQALLKPLGMVSSLAGSAPPVQEEHPESPKPGSALAVSLIRGDINLAATGTVTFLKGQRIFAFGHPMFQLGKSHLPLASAYIHTVIPNQVSSFKLASAGELVGTLIQDRADGIMGTLKQQAPLFNLNVELNRPEVGFIKKFHYQIAVHPQLTPVLTLIALMDTISAVDKSSGPSTIEFSSTLRLKNKQMVKQHTIISSENASLDALFTVMKLLSLMTNPYKAFEPLSMEVLLQISDERKDMHLLSVNTDKRTYTPGESIQLTVALRAYQQKKVFKKIVIPTDPTWKTGRYRIDVSDAKWYRRRRILQSAQALPPESFEGFFNLLFSSSDSSRIYLSLSGTARAVVVDDQVYPHVPPSIRGLLKPLVANGKGTVAGMAIEWEDSEPLAAQVTGHRAAIISLKDEE